MHTKAVSSSKMQRKKKVKQTIKKEFFANWPVTKCFFNPTLGLNSVNWDENSALDLIQKPSSIESAV